MEQTEFIKKILDVLSSISEISTNPNVLSSISEISTNPNDKYVGLFKSGVMFGKISNNKIFLLNDTNEFAEVEGLLRLLKPKLKIEKADCDRFLFEVTKAWWFALGKKINIFDINEIIKRI